MPGSRQSTSPMPSESRRSSWRMMTRSLRRVLYAPFLILLRKNVASSVPDGCQTTVSGYPTETALLSSRDLLYLEAQAQTGSLPSTQPSYGLLVTSILNSRHSTHKKSIGEVFDPDTCGTSTPASTSECSTNLTILEEYRRSREQR